MVRSTQDFDQFVKRQQELVVAEKPIDWVKVRDEWLSNLKSLYRSIHSYLEEYIDEGSIRIESQPIQLTEEDIGIYTVDKQTIHIGPQAIQLIPVGTMLIGAKGRVDVKGRAGSARFVMVDKGALGADRVSIRIVDPRDRSTVQPAKKQIDWTWKIATSPPAVRYIELNKESLRQLLLEVSNG